MKFFKLPHALAIATLTLSACAQHSNQIESTYVSPNVYSGRSCAQLMSERNDIVRRVNTLNKEQDKSATNDAVLTGVALIIFWPAAIGLAATKDNATAVSAAKGNYDAITEQMRIKGCTLPPEALTPLETKPTDGKKKRSWEE